MQKRISATPIVAIGTGAVAVVLVLGLLNMLGGENSFLPQKLMRWRASVQFAVIVIISGVLWFR